MSLVMDFANKMILQAETKTLKLKSDVPRCPAGLIEFEFNSDSIVPIICFLEYEAGEPQTDIDPAYPAQMHLEAAYIGSMDVSVALTVKQVAAIEEAAMGEQG